MLRLISVWFVEQAAMIFLGSCILLYAYGSSKNPNFPGFLGDIYQGGVFALFFYVASGFVASSTYFGFFARPVSPIRRAAVMSAVFVAHFVLFDFLIGGGKIADALMLAILGTAAVGVVTFIGSLISGRIGSE